MDGQLEGYLIALYGASHYALDITVNRVIRGEIEGLSRKYCPTAPELSAAIRSEMQFVERQIALAHERLQIADNRVVARRPVLIEERIQIARQKMADEGRALLLEVQSHAASLSPGRKMPPGSVYSGILCAWYGPPGSLRQEVTQEMLKADMFEPEPASVEAPDIPPAPPVDAYADVEF